MLTRPVLFLVALLGAVPSILPGQTYTCPDDGSKVVVNESAVDFNCTIFNDGPDGSIRVEKLRGDGQEWELVQILAADETSAEIGILKGQSLRVRDETDTDTDNATVIKWNVPH